MRRHESHVGFGKSFDSFLSIVTKNGLGMLILIAMASTFSNVQTLGEARFHRNLETPIVSPAPFGLQPIDLECRGNCLLPMDLETLQGNINLFNKLADPNLRKKNTSYHEVELQKIFTSVKVIYRPRADKNGFHLAEVKGPQAAFNDYLARWDPKQKYLYFHVRSDSFEVFREARQLAKGKGFEVGWQPLTPQKELAISFSFGVGLGGGGGGNPEVDR